MMVTLTSVTPHSSSSCLQSKLYTSPFISYSNSVNEYGTCYIAINSTKSSTRRRSLSIRCTATKTAKSPGNIY